MTRPLSSSKSICTKSHLISTSLLFVPRTWHSKCSMLRHRRISFDVLNPSSKRFALPLPSSCPHVQSLDHHELTLILLFALSLTHLNSHPQLVNPESTYPHPITANYIPSNGLSGSLWQSDCGASVVWDYVGRQEKSQDQASFFPLSWSPKFAHQSVLHNPYFFSYLYHSQAQLPISTSHSTNNPRISRLNNEQ